jgi:hypothetical protein
MSRIRGFEIVLREGMNALRSAPFASYDADVSMSMGLLRIRNSAFLPGRPLCTLPNTLRSRLLCASCPPLNPTRQLCLDAIGQMANFVHKEQRHGFRHPRLSVEVGNVSG